MNEIKKGYKQTDIGVIPDDWDVKAICDGIAEVKSGKRLPMGYYVTENKSEHPYIRVIDMHIGGVNMADIKYIPHEAYPAISNYRIFIDDIFISVAGTLGIVGKIPIELNGANLTENANRLTRVGCDRDFLMYYLISPYIQNVITAEQTVGAQPKLALTRIRNFQIPLPPSHAEQSAIATALSDVDALIAALDKKITKKQQIKQGAMQQLLTGKKRLPGFSGEWVEKTIGQSLTIKHGKNQKDIEDSSGRYPILGTGGIMNFTNIPLYTKQSVLIGRKGTIDKPQFFDTPFWTVDTLFYSEIKDGYSAKFIFYKFNQIDWYAYNEASGVPSLNAKVIESIVINFPPTLAEQTAIAQILTDLDKEISQLEADRNKYEQIKAGMMQQLLTGKIRLMVNG